VTDSGCDAQGAGQVPPGVEVFVALGEDDVLHDVDGVWSGDEAHRRVGLQRELEEGGGELGRSPL
jgi:hypothetical protein